MGSYYKEHDTPYGKIYSCWAFDENSSVMSANNRKVLENYQGRYVKATGDWEDVAKVCNDNPDKMVYIENKPSYHEEHYRVMQNPDSFSTAEVALIVDGGNLCFGFHGSPLYIDIYTD